MSRRRFLTWASVGWGIWWLLDQLANHPTVAKAQSDARGGFLPVGTVADLDQAGQILNERLSILVIRSPKKADALIAVNLTCPHQGCTVNWQRDRRRFLCPCHASRFSWDGKVLNGPASKPLKIYPAQIIGDSVLVKVSAQ